MTSTFFKIVVIPGDLFGLFTTIILGELLGLFREVAWVIEVPRVDTTLVLEILGRLTEIVVLIGVDFVTVEVVIIPAVTGELLDRLLDGAAVVVDSFEVGLILRFG